MRPFGIQKLYLKDEPTNTVQAASARLRSRQTITPNSCDIITITGNEECYIAQFIHHYLYLGFSNIFIGINNCQDKTPAILKKIAKIILQPFSRKLPRYIRKFLSTTPINLNVSIGKAAPMRH
jgi:hypothetical protein